MKLKKGDQVVILAGKDRNRKGKIEKILPRQRKVLVAGVNIYKKHVKPQGSNSGGVVDLVKPLPVGKVALICPKCGQRTRVGYRFVQNSKKRICKKCQVII